MIDIIIPTMWKAPNVAENIASYVQSPYINKVIVIDNNKPQRPDHEIFNNTKVELVCYNKNIYVNPAWNEGYLRSTQNVIGIINDDIIVSNDIFELITRTDFTDIDIIGVNLRSGKDNYTIGEYTEPDTLVKLNYDKTKPIGGQAWAFGICMFIKKSSYTVIPSLYQIWYGDDFLTQHAENIYVLMTNKIKGTISKTLIDLQHAQEINKRIELDSTNAYNHDHFTNGKNWDIFKHKMTKVSNVLEAEYHKARTMPSDINQNLHILYELGKECEHITEMGVRTGVSTRAFLNTRSTLVSYDIVLNSEVQQLFDYARSQGKDVKYIQADVLKIDIEPTDLLFIDTFHVYEQLKRELQLHASKAKKYIVFHDTYTFGLKGENNNDGNGLLTAIIEFLITNPEWQFKIHINKNNGLTVLERKYTT